MVTLLPVATHSVWGQDRSCAGAKYNDALGGGSIAVSTGKFGIAVISPPVDAAGNSVRAQLAIAGISNALGGNPYAQFGAVK